MQWRGLYYYDRCMPMGCSSSCLTFETFSTAVEWVAHNKLKIDYIFHLLDDYLLVAPSVQLCQQQLDLFLSLCTYLGIPIAPEKTCGPATFMSFAGIELDSILWEARLPLDELEKCVSLISEFCRRKKVTLKEIQEILEDTWLNSSKLNLFTDASGALGFGAIFGSHWCYGKWPSNWQYQNIAILEFYPIVLSLYLWGAAMSNQCIWFSLTMNPWFILLTSKLVRTGF